MRALLRLLRLELILQRRSFLYPATVVSTAILCAFVLVIPTLPASPELVSFLVFMDPATQGLAFAGAIVLAEKSEGTLVALSLTPIRPWTYICARTIGLTLVTLASGFAVVLVATRGAFDVPRQLFTLALCSSVAVLLGLICVAGASSMNQLVVRLLWVTTLLYLPLLIHFDVVPVGATPIFALIPSHAMLVALKGAITPATVGPFEQTYALVYLTVWLVLLWRWTIRAFEHSLVTEGR